MNATMIQQAIIELGEGSPWPGIFGLIALVSVGIVVFSTALDSDVTTPRKDKPLRHVTTFFAVVSAAAIILGILTSNF